MGAQQSLDKLKPTLLQLPEPPNYDHNAWAKDTTRFAQSHRKQRLRAREKTPSMGEKRPPTRKEKSKTAILSEFKIAVRSATPTVEVSLIEKGINC